MLQHASVSLYMNQLHTLQSDVMPVRWSMGAWQPRCCWSACARPPGSPPSRCGQARRPLKAINLTQCAM